MATTTTSSTPTNARKPLHAPAQPVYVLRGHQAQIHTVHFLRFNTRLLTGDGDGWIVIWALDTKRPTAVWKAHDNAVVGVAPWGPSRIITHGRDNKLCVWQLTLADEAAMDSVLPVVDAAVRRKQPWLLHVLDVNALNFCAFAMCDDEDVASEPTDDLRAGGDGSRAVLVAVPNAVDSGGVWKAVRLVLYSGLIVRGQIDILQLPTEKRISTIAGDKGANTGMVMSIHISSEAEKSRVIAGYESGHTMVFQRVNDKAAWQTVYRCQPHSQPVLSLNILPSRASYFTSSADAIIAKHPLAPLNSTVGDWKPLKVVQTKHSGQQSLRVRSDGKVLVTAGWDSRVRVYSTRTLSELAVLKWHKEGCYAVAFAEIDPPLSLASEDGQVLGAGNELVTVQKPLAVKTVQQERKEKARLTHWLAAGSKDGKVSLWDIY